MSLGAAERPLPGAKREGLARQLSVGQHTAVVIVLVTVVMTVRASIY